MPHYYPVVIPGGKSLAGDSLGFHAYSLRIDNLTNQWLLEETSLAWIPPYSLGVCLRLYGTGVGIILNQAPVGQPQLLPVTGEQAVGVYSDQMRTEVAGSPVRQYSLVQAVSDLTQGPQPALPPVGVDRLWADTSGNIHHIHSNGQDLTLVDPSQTGVVTSQMILDGTIQTSDLASGAASATTYLAQGFTASTNSGSILPVSGMTLSFTTKGGLVMAYLFLTVQHSQSGGLIQFFIRMDGGGWSPGLATVHGPGAGYLCSAVAAYPFGAAAGSHTFDVGWATNVGTATMSNSTISTFLLREFRA